MTSFPAKALSCSPIAAAISRWDPPNIYHRTAPPNAAWDPQSLGTTPRERGGLEAFWHSRALKDALRASGALELSRSHARCR